MYNREYIGFFIELSKGFRYRWRKKTIDSMMKAKKKRQPKRSARGERHAAAKEKNAADRRVVSYEDVPIDKYDEPTPIQPELIKKLLKVLLIIFACVILLLVILNWEIFLQIMFQDLFSMIC